MKHVAFKTSEAAAIQRGAMESETISKNGARSKSLKRNVLLIVLLMLSACEYAQQAQSKISTILEKRQQTQAEDSTTQAQPQRLKIEKCMGAYYEDEHSHGMRTLIYDLVMSKLQSGDVYISFSYAVVGLNPNRLYKSGNYETYIDPTKPEITKRNLYDKELDTEFTLKRYEYHRGKNYSREKKGECVVFFADHSLSSFLDGTYKKLKPLPLEEYVLFVVYIDEKQRFAIGPTWEIN